MDSKYLVDAVTTLLGKVRSSHSLQFTVDKAFQLLGSHHILGVFFKLLQFSDVILFNSCENCWTIDVFLNYLEFFNSCDFDNIQTIIKV